MYCFRNSTFIYVSKYRIWNLFSFVSVIFFWLIKKPTASNTGYNFWVLLFLRWERDCEIKQKLDHCRNWYMVGKQYFSSELNKDQPLLAVSRWQELVLLAVSHRQELVFLVVSHRQELVLLAVSRRQELVFLTYLPMLTLMENVSVIMSSTKLSIVCHRQNKN